jgi:hypothetical protein
MGDDMSNTTDRAMIDPPVWPACGTCGAAFIMRRGRQWSDEGIRWIWVWGADCKHPKRETREPVLMTADGPYVPPNTDEATP